MLFILINEDISAISNNHINAMDMNKEYGDGANPVMVLVPVWNGAPALSVGVLMSVGISIPALFQNMQDV